ncbi:hypothetical protein ACWIUD_04605 [Helicobacter sp. 23-1044]
MFVSQNLAFLFSRHYERAKRVWQSIFLIFIMDCFVVFASLKLPRNDGLLDSTNFVRDSAICVFQTIEVMAVVLWIIFA